jgi:very-short-patch-repair endonuclease
LLVIAAGLTRPHTQIEVLNDRGRVIARIDMGWPEIKVGIEYDGSQHWTDSRIRSNDIDRAAELSHRGWIVIRVSADLLRYRPDVVISRVREAIRSRGWQV